MLLDSGNLRVWLGHARFLLRFQSKEGRTAFPFSASATLTFLPRAKLLTVLGVTFGLAVTVGNMIGAGIVRTPGDIAAQLPTVWPFVAVWIVGGLYALLGPNALAELG